MQDKQRTFNHFFCHAQCPNGFGVWRSLGLGSLASSWNFLSQTFLVWWRLLRRLCFFHYEQQETPPGTSKLTLTGVTLISSRMVMLLRDWALWASWQTGRTLSWVATISAWEMTVKWPNCMAILLTKGPWVGLDSTDVCIYKGTLL